MANTYTQRLMEARRRATLSGRPLSQQETAGIAAGESMVASENAAREEQIGLQKKAQAEQERAQRVAERQRNKQMEVAEQTSRRNTVVGGAIAGAQIGATFGPYGAVIGGVAGGLGGLIGVNSSAFCTAVHKKDGLTLSQGRALMGFRRYVEKENLRGLRVYETIAPELVKVMAPDEIDQIKKLIVEPVARLSAKKKFKAAYAVYKKGFQIFVNKFVPQVNKFVSEVL